MQSAGQLFVLEPILVYFWFQNGTMATLTVKNIPDDLYEQLKKRARLNHRSINSEIIFSLKKVLGFRDQPEADEILHQVRDLRKQIPLKFSAEEISTSRRGKGEGQ